MAIDLLMQMREYFLLGVGHRAMKKDEKRGQQALIRGMVQPGDTT
jgi:hypothetical protein